MTKYVKYFHQVFNQLVTLESGHFAKYLLLNGLTMMHPIMQILQNLLQRINTI
ncbi:hypothetical protein ZOD2009_19038 [Haladaptatus paucihalophilus DX253]|uniref:Uncharacterized protein n=1 Tax=Haladaptatus paucihalophilus DX253 TaxID=797209 RepID=E7QYB7_HALPU|nr:hypothetical protein ZOD2009_19038 [Haladaptatus paucihalophilus DX253]